MFVLSNDLFLLSVGMLGVIFSDADVPWTMVSFVVVCNDAISADVQACFFSSRHLQMQSRGVDPVF